MTPGQDFNTALRLARLEERFDRFESYLEKITAQQRASDERRFADHEDRLETLETTPETSRIRLHDRIITVCSSSVGGGLLGLLVSHFAR